MDEDYVALMSFFGVMFFMLMFFLVCGSYLPRAESMLNSSKRAEINMDTIHAEVVYEFDFVKTSEIKAFFLVKNLTDKKISYAKIIEKKSQKEYDVVGLEAYESLKITFEEGNILKPYVRTDLKELYDLDIVNIVYN